MSIQTSTPVSTADQGDQPSSQTPSDRRNGDSRPKRRSVTENLRQELADVEAKLAAVSRDRQELQDQFDVVQKDYNDLSDTYGDGVSFRIELEMENNELKSQLGGLRMDLDEAGRNLEVETAVSARLGYLALKAVDHVVDSIINGGAAVSSNAQKQAVKSIASLMERFGKSNPADSDCQC